MKLSNKTYDFLKWFALVAIPAIEAFWLTVGEVWHFPYLTEVGATIAAVGLLIAGLLGLSAHSYNANLEQVASEDCHENQLMMAEALLEEDEIDMIKGE